MKGTHPLSNRLWQISNSYSLAYDNKVRFDGSNVSKDPCLNHFSINASTLLKIFLTMTLPTILDGHLFRILYTMSGKLHFTAILIVSTYRATHVRSASSFRTPGSIAVLMLTRSSSRDLTEPSGSRTKNRNILGSIFVLTSNSRSANQTKEALFWI